MSRENSLPCPICNAPTRVYDTRAAAGVVRRRRACENGHRFNTAEKAYSTNRLVVPDTEESYNQLEADLRGERGW